jgi:hypothetical protein
MKKLIYSLVLIVSAALIVFNLFHCVQEARAYHAGVASFYAALTLVWVEAGSAAIGGLLPSHRAWRAEHWAALVEWFAQYRVAREVVYALTMVLPVVAVPFIWIATIIVAAVSVVSYGPGYVRVEWQKVRASRKKIEQTYALERQSREQAAEAVDRAKAGLSV